MKKYYRYTKEEFIKNSKINLDIEKNNEVIFQLLANQFIETIEKNNKIGDNTVIICPVGPVGHYKYLVEKINELKLDLTSTWFINMDEYLTDDGKWISEDNVLSFRGYMKKNVYNLIDIDLVMPEEQRIFPNPDNLEEIPTLIKKLGKVDLVVGGIGINGHVAFNEPDAKMSNKEYLSQKTRVLDISPETRIANAIGDLSGAIEGMPKKCVTIGISEINSAEKIVLGCFRDWHKAVVRRTACGEVTSEFPVTLLQNHKNFCLYMSEDVADMGE